MHPDVLLRTTRPRRKTLALLAGVALSLPEARVAQAAPDGPGPLRRYGTTYAVPGFSMHLTLTIASHGSARVDGTMRLEQDALPRLLVAQGTGRATCADLDGDGNAGLTRLEAEFQDAETRAPFRLVLRSTGTDIDATGMHEITLELDGTPSVTGQAFIRVTRQQPPRRRRSRRRSKGT